MIFLVACKLMATKQPSSAQGMEGGEGKPRAAAHRKNINTLVTFVLDLVTDFVTFNFDLVTFSSPNCDDKFLCLVIIHINSAEMYDMRKLQKKLLRLHRFRVE